MTASNSPKRYQKHSCPRPDSGRRSRFSLRWSALAPALAAALAGCALGPAYQAPDIALPAAWKEAPAAAGWTAAAPADAQDRGAWWRLFGDPELDALAARVEVSNQNVAAAVAAYAQATALVREQRASLFPSLGLSGDARRSGNRSAGTATGTSDLTLGAAWAPDVWGRLRLAVGAARAQAEASQADLAAARLAAQGELATAYFSLREADAELALLDDTIAGYERALVIANNRYRAGVAAQTDVLQAQTLLVNTRANRVALARSRAAQEHAIAVLVGVAPADFSLLAAANWTPAVPAVPLAVPSELLQRRPDIAAAERAVAAANAQIGIARSAYFPSLSLSASLGRSASAVPDLFSAGSTLWSLGLSAAQVLFDAGAIGARVEEARAAQAAAAARYRQTVLAAFQGVEDQLTAAARLGEQEELLRQASAAADLVEQQIQNRYRAAQVSYTDVVTAQATALAARRALAQVRLNRQAAAVALIQALGGGWEGLAPPP